MTDRDPGCLFCRIAARELPAEEVHRDDEVVVFRDISPRAPTHLLAIPTTHLASAADLGPEHGQLLAALFGALRDAAQREGVQNGYRIVTNVGAEAGQSVQHLHFHLLGGRGMAWPPG